MDNACHIMTQSCHWHLHYALEVWPDHPVLAHGWLQLGVTNRSRLTVGLLEYESMLVWTHFPGRCLLQKYGPSGRFFSDGFRRLAPHLAHGGCKQSLHFHLFRCCFFRGRGEFCFLPHVFAGSTRNELTVLSSACRAPPFLQVVVLVAYPVGPRRIASLLAARWKSASVTAIAHCMPTRVSHARLTCVAAPAHQQGMHLRGFLCMHTQALLHPITRQLCDRKFQDREMFGTSEHFTPSLSATAGPVALCMWIGFGCQEQMHALQGSLVLERPLNSIRKNRALQELVQRRHPRNEAVSSCV